MKRIILLIYLLLSCCLLGMAQQPVSGKVVSAADGTPLTGATVRLKGTNTGTITSATGTFTLPGVRDGDTLQVNYLGYLPNQVAIRFPLMQPLVITLLENKNQLQEVVVSTGYQLIPQERATGSFTQVDRQQLSQQVSTDILSRLEPVANGLTVDRTTTTDGKLMIRGLSTIQGPRDPLIVVDNFPYEGDISNINPNDVASVTLLKDAAAASIWGTRAGNGVIVITTKKGRFNQPLSVEFNASATVAEKPDLFAIPQIATSDYIDVEQMLFSKGYYNSKINSSSRPALSPVVELLLLQQNGTLAEAEVQARLNALRQLDVRRDFDRYFYQPGLNQQYSLALKGGSQKHAWLLSGGYDKNTSSLDEGYDRLNLRFQNTIRPTRNLALNAGLYYTQSQGTGGRPGYGDVSSVNNSLYPYAQFADTAGKPLPIVKDYRQSFIDTAGGGRLLDWKYYPLEDYRHVSQTTGLQDVLGNLGLSYQLPGGLEAEVKYQYQRQQTTGENLLGAESYEARSLVNLYTQIEEGSGAVHYGIPKGAILDLSHSLLESHNGRAQLNFSKSWEKHELTALAGGEVRHTRTTGSSSRLYGYNPEIITFGNVDYATSQPTFVNGRNAYIPGNFGLENRLNRFVSAFVNAAYTYRKRYTLSGSARQDASNLFGVSANDRWNPLWSAGMAWDVSREPFYKLSFVPYLKLRATYGFSGSVDQGMAAVTTISYRGNSFYYPAPMARFSNYANPQLRWETAGMLNVGLDFGLVNDLLAGSVEFYRKKGTDLLGREEIDYTSGIGATVVKNVASMEGRGFDVELRSHNIRTSAFQWSTQLNLSRYTDQVTEYYLSSQRGSSFISSVPIISGETGRPVYGIYSYQWAGLDPQTGDPQGYVDGQVSTDYAALTGSDTELADLHFHGSALPTVFGSLGNTFSYKSFSLTARVSYKLGYYFRNQSVSYNSLYSQGRGHADFARRWQEPGDEAHTDVPSLVYPANSKRDAFYNGSEVLVERGDHVRLQYIQASYEFSREHWKRLPFKSLQAYVNLNNLGLLWKANPHGIDPDNPPVRYSPQQSRSYAVGIRATL